MKTILILEDNLVRAAAIERATSARENDYTVKVWNNVHSMRAECEAFFHDAVLITLDHDLTPQPGITADPGTGMDIAMFLADFMPVCPVIVHSQNMERVWSMYNELRFAGWVVKQAGGMGFDWSEISWLGCARELLAGYTNAWNTKQPADHGDRVGRMRLSLDGGDYR